MSEVLSVFSFVVNEKCLGGINILIKLNDLLNK